MYMMNSFLKVEAGGKIGRDGRRGTGTRTGGAGMGGARTGGQGGRGTGTGGGIGEEGGM